MIYTREELNRMSKYDLIELVEELMERDADAAQIRVKLTAIKNIIKGETVE